MPSLERLNKVMISGFVNDHGVGKLRPASSILCGPQGSHTYIDSTHFESMLK